MCKRWTDSTLEPSEDEYKQACACLKAAFTLNDDVSDDDDEEDAKTRPDNELGAEVILDDADNKIAYNFESEDNWNHIGSGSFTPNETLTIERDGNKLVFRVHVDFMLFLTLTKKKNPYAYSHFHTYIRNLNIKTAKYCVKTSIDNEEDDGYYLRIEMNKDFPTHPYEYIENSIQVYNDGLDAFFEILDSMEKGLKYKQESEDDEDEDDE